MALGPAQCKPCVTQLEALGWGLEQNGSMKYSAHIALLGRQLLRCAHAHSLPTAKILVVSHAEQKNLDCIWRLANSTIMAEKESRYRPTKGSQHQASENISPFPGWRVRRVKVNCSAQLGQSWWTNIAAHERVGGERSKAVDLRSSSDATCLR